MNDTRIIISKLPNGNFRVEGPTRSMIYEMAMNVVSEVRQQLNYLRLPVEEKPSSKGHEKFCQCDLCLADKNR